MGRRSRDGKVGTEEEVQRTKMQYVYGPTSQSTCTNKNLVT